MKRVGFYHLFFIVSFFNLQTAWAQSVDEDSDGVPDNIDNCTDCYNPDQVDTDSDGLGDCWLCDQCDGPGGDYDWDGTCDFVDNCPEDWNVSQEDADNDGVGDACDTSEDPVCPDGDADADGVCDGDDNCPETANQAQTDGDGDGIGDACETGDPTCDDFMHNGGETDVDCGGSECPPCGLGEGCVMNTDCAVGVCESGLCQPEVCVSGDGDGDLVCDDVDNCLDCYNPDQVDADVDGLGDCWVCDQCDGPGSDYDWDGICDDVDNCLEDWNVSQEDEDGDGVGDACDTSDDPVCPDGDADGDGVCDGDDNCPETANQDQTDGDGDGIGDACETGDPTCDDSMQNGDETDVDCGGPECPPCDLGDGCVVNADCKDGLCASGLCQPETCEAGDVDNDGVCDDLDNCTECANPNQTDADQDGLGDCWQCDQCDGPGADYDYDGVCDYVDNCPLEWNVSQTDTDEDGIGDACDPENEPEILPCDVGDEDMDGICDDVDRCVFCNLCAKPWGPMITFSFDDAYGSCQSLVMPELNARGMLGVFNIIVDIVQANGAGYLNEWTVRELARYGHEIGSHSWSHPFLNTLGEDDLIHEIVDSQTWIEDLIDQNVESFVSPMGAYNEAVLDVVRPYYTNHRTVAPYYFNYPGQDPYLLNTEGMDNDATPDVVAEAIDRAIALNGWIILTFHEMSEEETGWTYLMSDFREILDYVEDTGIEVVTNREGAARMACPQ